MNWDSFVPDLLVGLATGGLVGGVVLGAERRLSQRARRLEVTNAEGAVVEKARTVLRHPLVWDEDFYDLSPDQTQLSRLVPVVKAVPTGEPLERVPGIVHAYRVVQLLDEVDSSADAIFTERTKHETDHDVLAVPDAIAHNIKLLLQPPHDPLWAWEWPERGGRPRLSPGEKAAIEQDVDLRQYLDEYVRNRRLLESHREAFLLVDGSWRADEWTALLAKTRNAPRFFITKWRRALVYKRDVQRAVSTAEQNGYDIITKIDPMAY